jgi:predicted DNA-binding transcriptional regulator AlpA
MTKSTELATALPEPVKNNRSFLTVREVEKRVHLKYVAIYKKMKNNEFPKSFMIGRVAYWLEHEVEAWIDSCIASREMPKKAS